MRRLGLLPLLALACVVAPIRPADASVTTDVVSLSPSQGAPGAHFTATFDFGGVACDAYRAYLDWEASDTRFEELGEQDAVSSGQDCVATISAVVPPADAVPGQTYTVVAIAHPKQVNTADGSVVAWSSNDPSATAPFAVTSPPATSGGGGGTQAKPSSHTSTAPQGSSDSAPRGAAATASTSSAPADGSAAASDTTSSSDTSDGSTTTEPSPRSKALLITTTPLHAPSGGGLVEAALAGLAACIGIILALGWAHRTGRLRGILRR